MVSRASADEVLSLLTLDPKLRKQVHEDLERLMARTRILVADHRAEIEALAELLVTRKAVPSGGADDPGRRPKLDSKI